MMIWEPLPKNAYNDGFYRDISTDLNSTIYPTDRTLLSYRWH